ncbi:hypothetical protein [Bradyrhizobium cajani]|uniref:Uncharacterized protein n=1 Tax=Bradyrhizobium cajani TaxID=1928661 RepID=A0A844TGY3_9BRAD|nr:hypothetical protein [Bradyrhizobium cajani]MCP3370774.1 hypothetical protein [Bradyrhizobium cajani]MVT75879.1 hypothetical protein [Bradyrhizobium cajani]
MNQPLIQPRTVYHVSTGSTVMNGVDAAAAVSNHPLEWSYEPWTDEVLAKVRANIAREAEINHVPVVGALLEEPK